MSALDLNNAGELYCPTCETSFASGDRCPTDNTRLVRLARPRDQLIGRELDGRYTIIDRIGEGGMGTVYRGKQHSVGREVAIKVVSPGLVREPIAIKRFLREAKLASSLTHPNAVAVLDFGQTDDGLFFLVMELVAGRTLDKVLEAEGALPPSRVVRIAAQICDALEGAHALDIVHRDLKPSNVMIISTGRDLVKVLDFGLAKSLSSEGSAAHKTTHAGALLGTPAYMPPELVSGNAVDGRADLYSLGVVLYQAASGQLPFWSESVHDLVTMHVNVRPPKLVGLPRRLAEVIERLLAKNPADRFPSAAAAREALEATVTMIPDTLDESPGFASTLLGWDGRTRTDTIKSVSPPSLVMVAARPIDESSDPGLPRTPLNASVAWEAGAITPIPRDHVDPFGGGTDTVRVDSGIARAIDLKATPIPWGASKPVARGSAPLPSADGVPKVIKLARIEPQPRSPGPKPIPIDQLKPQPRQAGSTMQVRALPKHRKIVLAAIAVTGVIALVLVGLLAFGGGESAPRDPVPPPAPPPKPTVAPIVEPPAPPPPPAPVQAVTPPPVKPAPVVKPKPVVKPPPPPPPKAEEPTETPPPDPPETAGSGM